MAALTEEDRAALLAALRPFVAGDPIRFVCGRLVEANDTCFPEPWSRTEEGLHRVAQRLLLHAGLGHLRAEVAVAADAIDPNAMLPDTRTDLAGVEGEVVHFSCSRLGRADDAALSLTHEVARAALLLQREGANDGPYRASPSRLRTPPETADDHYEASILAVHLGLGLLVARGAHTYRAAGRTVGRSAVTAWQHVAYGGLSPEATSYLVALQLVVRGAAGERLDALLSSLPADRQAEVREEMGRLERTEIVTRLVGAPPSAGWPPEESGPVPPLPTWEPVLAARSEVIEGGGRRPVFRVRADHRGLGIVLGGFGTLAMVLALNTVLPPQSGTVWVMLLVVVVGIVGGGVLGTLSGFDECSGCERRLDDSVTRCRRCARPIGGRIRSRNERLEAEERWLRDRAD